MKIRNKKTGQIVEIELVAKDDYLLDRVVDKYNGEDITLKVLNGEWEDYEEPKGYFYIRDGGNIDYYRREGSITERHKAIGNYFETKEEAEKTVEKLKAWKRLKDKGFKFVGVRGIGKEIDFDTPKQYNHVWFDEYNAHKDEKEFYNDLLLLFGGEE